MDESKVVTYRPNYKQHIGFLGAWTIMIKNIINSRELIWQLFKRDFVATYKKSFLGLSWILISPVIGVFSWILLNAAGILDPGDLKIPFTAYVLISSSIWGLFMGFYGAASGTLSAGNGFILQVKYSHEALLAKQTAQHLANFSITFILNIIILLLYGVTPDWKIVLLPFLALPLFFLGAGMGLIISVVSVVASDLTNLFNIALGFVFYATPILYDVNKVESDLLRTAIRLNPLTYLVGGVRDLIVFGETPRLDLYFLISALSFIFFMLAWRLFFVSEDKVIEKLL